MRLNKTYYAEYWANEVLYDEYRRCPISVDFYLLSFSFSVCSTDEAHSSFCLVSGSERRQTLRLFKLPPLT